MSWLARSIANSLKSDFSDDESDEEISKNGENQSRREKKEEEREEIEDRYGLENPGRGVKEDLSELTQTLTRQFWGVASFLAPPPPPRPPPPPPPPRPPPPSQSQSQSLILHSSSGSSCLFDSRDPDPGPVDSPRLADIRSDFAEFGGRFRNGISRLSSNKAVSGFSKIASSFIPFGSEEGSEEEYGGAVSGAVGVTDEVLAFARNISMHPETWLDFPLFIDDEYSDDFDMSDVQQEHALAIERLAPRLAALRIELCPSHMSEGCFWKIYFVLLHSRLNKHDAELLLTPQIVEARALWLQELQKQTKPDPGWFGRTTSSYSKGPVHSKTEEYLTSSSNILSETTPLRAHTFEPVNSIPTTDVETQKHCVTSMEMRIINKSVVEERPLIQTTSKDISSSVSKPLDPKFEDEGDDWLEEDNTEIVSTTIPIGNDEDVSFSDLEDDDDRSPPMSSKTLTDVSDSSMKDSRGWVQLSRSTSQSRKDGRHHQADTKESGDWLNVDELDTD